jgi:oligopeptide transport system ATP-binding protein
MDALIDVRRLGKTFPVNAGFLRKARGGVRAVDDVSFQLRRGESLGVVGESGCGKSTLGRLLLRLHEASAGEVLFEGQSVLTLKGAALKDYRRRVQMIFQDPYSSLNPRMTVSHILETPLKAHGFVNAKERESKVRSLLARVGLGSWALDRYPHEFSGGQRQRIAIARALMLDPKLIVADEPVSALDVSVQAQVLNLMNELRKDLGLGFVFISHNLAVVRHMSDRVAVMYLGRIVEEADRETLFRNPKHPYTIALLSANPVPGRKAGQRQILKGELPSPLNPPTGCTFHPRCPLAEERCKVQAPLLRNIGTEDKPQRVACHLIEGA